MQKIRPEVNEQVRHAKEFWEDYVSSKPGGIERTLISEALGNHVSLIVRWIDFVRPLVKNSDFSKFRIGNDPVDRNELFTFMIVQRIELIAFFVHAPEKHKIILAKKMYAELRKRFRDRLKVWDLLLVDEPVLERLKLSKSAISNWKQQDSQVASGLLKVRAGSKKLLKELCYYPMLLLLRFSGVKHSQRVDLMHEVLTFVEAPQFGYPQYADEELDRIKKWDKESKAWCDKLFREKV